MLDKILTAYNVNFNSCRSELLNFSKVKQLKITRVKFHPLRERIVVPRAVHAKIFTDIPIKF